MDPTPTSMYQDVVVVHKSLGQSIDLHHNPFVRTAIWRYTMLYPMVTRPNHIILAQVPILFEISRLFSLIKLNLGWKSMVAVEARPTPASCQLMSSK